MKPLIDLPDYAAARRGLTLAIPEFYNFGFDCIDRRAREHVKRAFFCVGANPCAVREIPGSQLPRPAERVHKQMRGLGAQEGE
jgi:hypothetical protein